MKYIIEQKINNDLIDLCYEAMNLLDRPQSGTSTEKAVMKQKLLEGVRKVTDSVVPYIEPKIDKPKKENKK